MAETWVCSDHHFGHDNIIKFAGRPFVDVIEMNEELLRRHNGLVGENDRIFFLGDVAWNSSIYFEYLSQMKGKKTLILGNHDNLPLSTYQKHFVDISGAASISKDSVRLDLTHYPATPESFNPNGKFFNVHGHIHEKLVMHNHKGRIKSDPRYYNVCVEHTNYGPVHLDEIIEAAKLTKHLL